MSKIAAGIYKGRGVEGSAQIGRSSKGTEEVCIDLEIPALGRTLTTFLYFSEDAAPYSLERLRAMGWKEGDDPSFPGISTNEVDVEIRYEVYKGEEKMKVSIMTGGGRVVVKDTLNAQELRGFMSRVKGIAKTSTPTGAANTPDGKIAL